MVKFEAFEELTRLRSAGERVAFGVRVAAGALARFADLIAPPRVRNISSDEHFDMRSELRMALPDRRESYQEIRAGEVIVYDHSEAGDAVMKLENAIELGRKRGVSRDLLAELRRLQRTLRPEVEEWAALELFPGAAAVFGCKGKSVLIRTPQPAKPAPSIAVSLSSAVALAKALKLDGARRESHRGSA